MPNQPAFQNLNGHQYMALTTYRRSGAGVPTAVWFAQDGDRLFIVTQDGSGKVKRIRNNAGVRVAPSDAGGRWGRKLPARRACCRRPRQCMPTRASTASMAFRSACLI